ncbi:hypothetical protein TI39_contig336g00001 [Zymoseptoria brevis]|uniref:Uncharacterized protein n=1 Tax=Zymoseptoria brevis TaxID=1047168 RepID=A0A0F4GSX0_9PEZI|nr:hypothetical protein TI39_contig336g00001 [Zymoseptoria brevis]
MINQATVAAKGQFDIKKGVEIGGGPWSEGDIDTILRIKTHSVEYNQQGFDQEISRVEQFAGVSKDLMARRYLAQSYFVEMLDQGRTEGTPRVRVAVNKDVGLKRLYLAMRESDDGPLKDDNLRFFRRFWEYLHELRMRDHFALLLLCTKNVAHSIPRSELDLGQAIKWDPFIHRLYVEVSNRLTDEPKTGTLGLRFLLNWSAII